MRIYRTLPVARRSPSGNLYILTPDGQEKILTLAETQAIHRTVFESLDTNQLATITQDAHAHWAHYEGDLDLWEYVALAVKNWLTGKDQQ